jgi:hypothetical protein
MQPLDTGTARAGAGELRHGLAEALGEEPDRIKATNPRWLQLMQEGC